MFKNIAFLYHSTNFFLSFSPDARKVLSVKHVCIFVERNMCAEEILHARHWKITRLWNIMNSASPSSCIRTFVSVSMTCFQRLSLCSLKWYMAIPHLCAPTKFMIQKNILAVALSPEMVPLNFLKIFCLLA